MLCLNCHERKNIYLHGLCFNCAMDSQFGKAHPQEEEPAPPLYPPLPGSFAAAMTNPKLQQAVADFDAKEAEEERGRRPLLVFDEDLDAGIAAGRLLNKQGYAQMPDGYWMVTAAHMQRVAAQVRHLNEQLAEARRGNLGKVEHAGASGALLASLIPGGER